MNSNSKRGAVEFTTGVGTTYWLRMTTNAQVRFQDAEGKTLIRALADMEGGDPNIKTMRAMFQHCLTPPLDAEDAGDLMDEIGIVRAAEMIGKAAQLAYPSVDPDAAARPTKALPEKPMSSVSG